MEEEEEESMSNSVTSSLEAAEELKARLAALEQKFMADTLALAALMEERLVEQAQRVVDEKGQGDDHGNVVDLVPRTGMEISQNDSGPAVCLPSEMGRTVLESRLSVLEKSEEKKAVTVSESELEKKVYSTAGVKTSLSVQATDQHVERIGQEQLTLPRVQSEHFPPKDLQGEAKPPSVGPNSNGNRVEELQETFTLQRNKQLEFQQQQNLLQLEQKQEQHAGGKQLHSDTAAPDRLHDNHQLGVVGSKQKQVEILQLIQVDEDVPRLNQTDLLKLEHNEVEEETSFIQAPVLGSSITVLSSLTRYGTGNLDYLKQPPPPIPPHTHTSMYTGTVHTVPHHIEILIITGIVLGSAYFLDPGPHQIVKPDSDPPRSQG
jgi:hypothetical protein